jgi:hypothetical protein
VGFPTAISLRVSTRRTVTAVIVELTAGGVTGLGWIYADGAAVDVVESKLAPALDQCDLDCIGTCWLAMRGSCATTATPVSRHARSAPPTSRSGTGSRERASLRSRSLAAVVLAGLGGVVAVTVKRNRQPPVELSAS